MGDITGPEGAARLFDVPTSWVYAAAESGRIPSFKIGKYRRFRVSELLGWLETQRAKGAGR